MIRTIRRLAAVAVTCLLSVAVSPVFAADAVAATPAVITTASSTAVDFASWVTGLEDIIFSVIGAIFVWLAHRGLAVAEGWLGIKQDGTHGAWLDSAISAALGLARSRLDEALRGKTTVDAHNALAAAAAQLVMTAVPASVAHLGLDERAVEGKILGLLGLELPPIQTVETPAPAPEPAPAAAPDYAALVADTVKQTLALLQSAQITTSGLAAAPAAAPGA